MLFNALHASNVSAYRQGDVISLADHIARYTSAIEAVDHNLTLKGLKLLYELNRS